PRDDLKQSRFRCVQKEMIARQHSQRERSRSMFSPAIHLLAANLVVPKAAKNRNGTAQRLRLRGLIGLTELKISPQYRSHQVHHLGFIDNLDGSAIEHSHFLGEFVVGQRVGGVILVWQLRSATARNKQVNRLDPRPPLEKVRNLETQYRAHAMTEER